MLFDLHYGIQKVLMYLPRNQINMCKIISYEKYLHLVARRQGWFKEQTSLKYLLYFLEKEVLWQIRFDSSVNKLCAKHKSTLNLCYLFC